MDEKYAWQIKGFLTCIQSVNQGRATDPGSPENLLAALHYHHGSNLPPDTAKRISTLLNIAYKQEKEINLLCREVEDHLKSSVKTQVNDSIKSQWMYPLEDRVYGAGINHPETVAAFKRDNLQFLKDMCDNLDRGVSKIEVIKKVREITGMTLPYAKDFVYWVDSNLHQVKSTIHEPL